MSGEEPAALRWAQTPAERQENSIRLPDPVSDPEPVGLPWLTALAPAGFGVLLAVTSGSPMPLLFAGLGPLLAICTVIERRRTSRRRVRAERARYASELSLVAAAVEQRRSRERARHLHEHPDALRILGGAVATGPAIRHGERRLVLGITELPSGIRLEGRGGGDEATQTLIERAGRLPDLAFELAADAVGIAGPPGLLSAAALAIIVHALHACPEGIEVIIAGGRAAAHLRAELAAAGLLDAGAVRLVLQAVPGSPPPLQLQLHAVGEPASTGTDAVLWLHDAATATVLTAQQRVRVRPQLVTARQVRAWAEHRGFAGTGTARGPEPSIPARQQELLAAPPPPGYRVGGGHLAAPVGVGEHGAVWIDLVEQGPHAVIGGTTGSGKSELLRGWLLALAARYPATELGLLCLDFKGGATFDELGRLPHTLGIVTDLDAEEAPRLLAGLRAELRRREELLREAGVRDIARLPPGTLARLLLAVDEFQSLLAEHPPLHLAFSDLAARGRSLGIHLLLCAQRPAAAARESLLANCAIRICLRVTSAADSRVLLGSDDAARIDHRTPGRAVLALGDQVQPFQAAPAAIEQLERVARRRHEELRRARTPPATRPWLPPLPRRLPLDALLAGHDPAAAGACFGLADDPGRQRQLPLIVRPGGRHLLVLGPPGCGRSTAARAVAAAAQRAGIPTTRLPPQPEQAWDLLHEREPRAAWPGLLIIDDLDRLAGGFGDEHRAAWLGRLELLLRLGAAGGLTAVITARRCHGELGFAGQHAAQVLRLGSPSRQEFLLSGGEPSWYRGELPPGRGVLGSLLVQIAHPGAAAAECALPAAAPLLVPAAGLAVVTRQPGLRAAQLRAAGIDCLPAAKATAAAVALPSGAVMLGAPEDWLAAFGALAAHAVRRGIVLDGIAPAQLRSLLPGDPLPPPISDPVTRALLRTPDGGFHRRCWPAAAG